MLGNLLVIVVFLFVAWIVGTTAIYLVAKALRWRRLDD